MKIAYFDCFSGISGDMIIGALLDAGLDFNAFKCELNKLNLSGYDITAKKSVKQHLAGTKFNVRETDKQDYRHLEDLVRVIDASKLKPSVQETACAIFRRIAQAEAKVHNQPVNKVHFHEIGALDTIVDVVGALVALDLLGIKKIYCSRLNVGSGFIAFSHGTYPVPAPATAELLKNSAVYSSGTQGELVTPTGAAIITTVAESFGDMPNMRIERIGYGTGDKDFDHPNMLRVFIGELHENDLFERDVVSIIETNIDDMNPQVFEYVQEKLFGAGALDVYMTHILMKKNRPAVQMTVLCEPELENTLSEIVFRETTTIGVRIRREARKKLTRETVEVDTDLGKVRLKISTLAGEVINRTPEYEDCKRIARESKRPLREVMAQIKRKADKDLSV